MSRNFSARPLVRRLGLPLTLAALALAAPPALRAEVDPNLERGFNPEKVYAFGEVDQVNLFNGNLMLNLPLGGGSSVNGGLGYGLTLSYNSNVWDFEGRSYQANPPNGTWSFYLAALPNQESNAGLGWTVSLGKLHASGAGGKPYWRYLGADGAEHPFYPSLHLGESSVAGVYYSRDGSYLRLRKVSTELVYELDQPDGRILKFTRATTGSPFQLVQIRDPFGNAVAVSYTATRWTISDGHRTHYVDFTTGANGPIVSSVDLAAFGGARALYGFAYTNATISRSCLDTDPTSFGGTPDTANVTFLSSLTLPDGSSYTFDQYNATCFEGAAQVKNLPGTLRRMTLPTLGKLVWTYQTYTMPSRAAILPQNQLHDEPNESISEIAGVRTKEVRDAANVCQSWDGVGCRWTYGVAESGVTRSTTVQLPTADTTKHYFNQSIELDVPPGSGWEYGLPVHTGLSDGAGRLLSQEV